MKFQYSIAGMLKFTVLAAFLAWICKFEAGRIAVLGIGAIALGSVGFVVFVIGLTWLFAYTLGTPGQRQLERDRETAARNQQERD